MYFLGELRFQLVLLVNIQIGLLNSIQNPVGDFGIVFDIQNLLTTIFIV